MTRLSVRDLTVRYGARVALDAVSLDAAPGETVAVVGASGSGKSSLALAVMGLLDRHAAQQGTITIDGREVTTLDAAASRALNGRTRAMVFQDAGAALDPRIPIGAQIAEVAIAHGETSATTALARAVAMLDALGFADAATRADAYPHELSGGQRQRVLLAMALLLDPPLLIADEPTSALDVLVQQQVLATIVQRQRVTGMAVVLISHDLGAVAAVAQQIVVLHEGRVVESGPAREVLAAPQHGATRALRDAVLRVPARVSA
jgi:ABC-type glutathione transport system ATPase component